MRVGDLQLSVAVLAPPDLVRIDLTGQATAPRSSGRALWSRERGMVFAASNLPAPPAGRGLTYFSTPPDIPAPTAVAVTLEPTGGVPAPTRRVLPGRQTGLSRTTAR